MHSGKLYLISICLRNAGYGKVWVAEEILFFDFSRGSLSNWAEIMQLLWCIQVRRERGSGEVTMSKLNRKGWKMTFLCLVCCFFVSNMVYLYSLVLQRFPFLNWGWDFSWRLLSVISSEPFFWKHLWTFLSPIKGGGMPILLIHCWPLPPCI